MRPSAFLLTCALLVPAVSAFGQTIPSFERIPLESHIYDGGWEHFVGGGVASFDCDGDHLPELYAAGGENPATLFRNRSARGGDLKFKADTPDNLAITGATGAYPINIDGDAYIDLVVLRVGQNKVMKGLGDCQFAAWDAIDLGAGWSTAFSATWEDGNSWPTLAIGNYVDRDDPDGPFEACDANYLYRPDGNAYAEPLTLEPGFCALSMLFSDWGLNGQQDLRISNDRHYYVRNGEEQLWAMERRPRLYTAEDGWQSYSLWGMGIASRDITGDGIPEIYLTSMGDQKLQSLDPEAYEKPMIGSEPFARIIGGYSPTYSDATYERGTTAHRPYTGDDGRPSTGWHVAFGDVQNDGLDDIFIAKGNVDQMPGMAMQDPNNLLLQGETGGFSENGLEAGLATMERSRGAAVVDLNLDGYLDVAVVNRRAEIELHQNKTKHAGHWLGVSLLQDRVNRHGIGAIIQLKVGEKQILREVTIGGGHAGGYLGAEHFGLGNADWVELAVRWPGLPPSEWIVVNANQYVEISRGKALTLIVKPY